MHRSILLLFVSAIACMGAGTSVRTTTPASDVTRRIYISATDGAGMPVTDLIAGDIRIKEGGKDRPVESLNPATTSMHVTLLVDDAGSGAFQAAVARLVERMRARCRFSIWIIT